MTDLDDFLRSLEVTSEINTKRDNTRDSLYTDQSPYTPESSAGQILIHTDAQPDKQKELPTLEVFHDSPSEDSQTDNESIHKMKYDLKVMKAKMAKRKEQNRQAARRARKRRLEREEALVQESHGLAEENQQLQEEVQRLRQERHCLQSRLNHHLSVCPLATRKQNPSTKFNQFNNNSFR